MNSGIVLRLALVLLALGFGWGIHDVPQEAGMDVCIDCHDLMNESFQKTLHLAIKPGDEIMTICETCHGLAEEHLEAGGGGGNIFAFLPDDPPGEIIDRCGACHEPENSNFGESLHMQVSNTCLSCHFMHPEEPESGLLLDVREKVCLNCHENGDSHIKEMKDFLDITEDIKACIFCHDPHSLRLK